MAVGEARVVSGNEVADGLYPRASSNGIEGSCLVCLTATWIA